MRSRLTLVLASIAASTHLLAGGQTSGRTAPPLPQDMPVFRGGVEVVRFDAVVTDKHGDPVTDLVAEDFEIRESGVLQTVHQFSRVVLPPPDANRPAMRTVRAVPDVRSNDDDQDRIYIIVLDSIAWADTVRATRIVQRFLDGYFSDRDMAAIVTIDRVGAMHFTSDRAYLLNQTKDFVQRAAEGYVLGYQRYYGINPRGLERARIFGDIARSLAHIEARRKSILYISNGIGFDPFDAIDRPTSSFAEGARAAMEPIMAGNLTVYPFCTCFPEPMRTTSMRALAYVTGGVPTGTDLNEAFRQIVRDNSSYYVLGYESTNQRRDGGFRKIEVRVTRPGVKVRARDGYFVEFPASARRDRFFSFNGRSTGPPPSDPIFKPTITLTADLSRALASPVAMTAVPMKVFAAPHSTGSRQGAVTIVVEIPAHGLDLRVTDQAVTGTIDVGIVPQMGRRILADTGLSYDVNVAGAAREQLLRNGIRLTAEVRLDPGEYRLHVAAGSRTGRTGKVIYDIVVPDFTRDLLMLSGVSLASDAAGAVATVNAAAVRTSELPQDVTASREFSRAETITLYTELYENTWWTDAEHAISLTTALRGANGEVIPMTSERRSSKAPKVSRGGHGFVARLPLADVPPGAYVLRVEARSEYEASRMVAREVPITVR